MSVSSSPTRSTNSLTGDNRNCRLQEAKVHRRAVNNWHVARVAAERELTTDMLGTQRKCGLVPVPTVHMCIIF